MRRFAPQARLAGSATIAFALMTAFATGCSTSTASDAAAPVTEVQNLPPGVERAAPADANPDSLLGIDWIFVSLAGFSGDLATLIPVPGFILQPEARMMSGNTSCNPMKAGYILNVDAGTLSFRNLVNLNGLCQRNNADAESVLVDAMLTVDGYRIVGGNLQLLSKGSLVATLRPK